MESIVQRHPFVDGNKRTGLLAAIFSLELSGYALDAPDDEQTEVSVETAEHRLHVNGLSQWLQDRARPSGS
ncbi:MAG TPA: type II toxin-antitoxin system death-on-curing family toxin [Rubrobacter sp.]|nr:type II toxin-antitoxin system death-on-curing family toxin [Rubrobacter sp.]